MAKAATKTNKGTVDGKRLEGRQIIKIRYRCVVPVLIIDIDYNKNAFQMV